LHGEFLRISRMWKREFERIMLRRLYGTKHMENRGIDRDEIASARVQCGNRLPLRFSSFLSLSLSLSLSLFLSLSFWLNVSLSSFSASISIVLLSLSSLSYSFFAFHYIQPIAQIFACLSFSICSRFILRFVYFVFSAKFNLQFSLHALLIFPFCEIHEILCLVLTWWSDLVSFKNISSHALRKMSLFRIFYVYF